MVGRDKTHATHVRRECVDVVDAASRLKAGIPPPQVEKLELVAVGLSEFRQLDVDAADPMTLLLESGGEVMSYESTGSGDEHTFHCYPSVTSYMKPRPLG